MVPRAANPRRDALIARWLRAAGCGLLLAAAGLAQASSLRYCDRPAALSAGQNDTLLRFGDIVKGELERSGQRLAIVSRSGLNLGLLGVRYSHAGVSLKASADLPWAVRQLYYACDEGLPRVFDQGMAGFVMGTDDPRLGYVSLLLLPDAAAEALERAALDNRLALQLLAGTYSANAYAFSLRYQNCNQWLAELMATAWGGLDAGGDGLPPRAQAQQWLSAQGYAPSAIDVRWRPITWAAMLSPWLHNDDHPAEQLAHAIYQVSMPASIEGFVQARYPEATRIEICHTGRQVVVHRGWAPVAEGCVPEAGDTVIPLD